MEQNDYTENTDFKTDETADRKLISKWIILIIVIFILWMITFPAQHPAIGTPIASRVLQNGVNLHKALVNYASVNQGFYPDGENANEALGYLVDDLTSEKPFFSRGSPWHGIKFAEGPDNLWEYSNPTGTALEAGENAWSYTRDLNPESPANLPLLATIRRGKTKSLCLVVYADGRGKQFKIKEDTIRPSELFPDVNMVDPLPPPEGLPK